MNKKTLGIVSIAGLLVLGGFYYLGAQMGGQGMGQGQMQGQRQMQGGMNRPQMGMLRGGMAGGSAMAAYDKFIYVLSGQTLYKVNPVTMKTEKELSFGNRGPRGGGQGRPAPMPGEDE
ncbi:MAG: hypothetical protein COX65_05485 [Elusimicrobia bacterium CG_4_10_14_0_2_um_filter_56_8]|nr:MAG: hypothetical protein AUJ51_07865 [Elusimicrobia bacterium CG1_02_56_21]PJA14537.1 MAG: hypothetical protein COX65_05485 [Elusimicrobia bacterium CG_4_10_14_0_2_um_filter_56_8]